MLDTTCLKQPVKGHGKMVLKAKWLLYTGYFNIKRNILNHQVLNFYSKVMHNQVWLYSRSWPCSQIWRCRRLSSTMEPYMVWQGRQSRREQNFSYSSLLCQTRTDWCVSWGIRIIGGLDLYGWPDLHNVSKMNFRHHQSLLKNNQRK